MVSNTLHIIIDPSGAQRGSAQTVQAINSIVNATTNLNIQINQTNNNLDRVGRAADRNSSLLKKMSNAWLALKSAMILSIPLKMFDMFIDKIISVDRSYQQFMASMFVTTKSSEKSREAFEFVARAARAYGVELETLSKSYAKFRASASATLPTQAIDRLFLSVTAVASVLHMAPQSVDRMLTAFTQMAAKGQIYSEELKQQLGEHLPGAVALAAQAMGVSVRKLMDDMKKGKVDIVKFFSNMPDVIMQKFGKAAEISALSIQSQINNLKSTIYKNFVDLNESGAALGLAKFIQSIDNILQPTTEHFKAFGAVVGEAFLKAADFINALTPEQVANFASQVVECVSALIQIVAWLAQATSFAVQNGSAILNLIIAYGALRVAILGYTAAAAGSVVGSSLAAKGLGVLGAVAALVASFIAGWQIGTILREKFLSVELFGIALARKLHQIIQGFIDTIKVMISISAASFKSLAEGAINAITGMATGVANLVPGINIKAPKVNFGAKEAWSGVASKAQAAVSNWTQIGSGYDSLAEDAIGRRSSGSDRINKMSSDAKNQIEEQRKLMAEFDKLKAEADAALAKMPKSADTGKEKKKKKGRDLVAAATREFVSYINEVVDNMKKAYDDKVQEIKNLVDAEELSPTQGFQRQIEALKKYTGDAEAEIHRALSRQKLTAKMKEDLNGKLLDLDRNLLNETKKLQTEMAKERKEYLENVSDLEESVGIKRINNLDKFVKEWNKTHYKLIQRATMENDTETLKRLDDAYNYGIAKASYKANDSVGFSQSDAYAALNADNGDIFKFDQTIQAATAMNKYNETLKTLAKLYEDGSIGAELMAEATVNAAASMDKAIRKTAEESSKLKTELGTAAPMDYFKVMVGELSNGFTSLRASALQTLTDVGISIGKNLSTQLKDVIIGAKSLGEAFASIGETIISTVIEAIIQMGIQWAATTAMNQALGMSTAATATASAASSGAAITAAMAPAAATTSLATMGANTITASTGVLAFGAVLAAMLGALLAGAFDNGGYIPDGKLGIVGEYGPEIIKGPVAVTGRKTTEDILSSAAKGNSAGGSSTSSNSSDPVEVVNNNNFKFVNVFDRSMVHEELAGPVGEKIIMNVVSRNRSKI